MDVVCDERNVEDEGEPLATDKEEEVEEEVKDILGKDKGVETGALVDRILVVGLQLVERDDLRQKKLQTKFYLIYFSKSYVENGEEDEESVDNQSHDVGKGSERKSHYNCRRVYFC